MSPILTVSCQTGEGIDKFINLLQNVTLNERTMGEMLPHVYLRLETQVKVIFFGFIFVLFYLFVLPTHSSSTLKKVTGTI